jgi:hypothetical protein
MAAAFSGLMSKRPKNCAPQPTAAQAGSKLRIREIAEAGQSLFKQPHDKTFDYRCLPEMICAKIA